MRKLFFLALTLANTLLLSAPSRATEPQTSTASLPAGARSLTFTEAELNSFRKGNKATFVIVPAMLPDEEVAITMSLKGFTAGYEAVVKANP